MGVFRILPHGPGLSGLNPDPVTIESDNVAEGSLLPDERSLNVSTTATDVGELTSGTWAATAHTCKMGPYPFSEFCYLLEGSVQLTTDNNEVSVFRKGEAFFIEKETVVEWKQLETVRKFYVIHSSPGTIEPRAKL